MWWSSHAVSCIPHYVKLSLSLQYTCTRQMMIIRGRAWTRLSYENGFHVMVTCEDVHMPKCESVRWIWVQSSLPLSISLRWWSLASCLSSVSVSYLYPSLFAGKASLPFFRLSISPMSSSLRLSHMVSIPPISHSASVILPCLCAPSMAQSCMQWNKFSAVVEFEFGCTEYGHTYVWNDKIGMQN